MKTMKLMAAWVILMGLFSLILAPMGKHIGLLWIFEEFGRIPAYGLKIGLLLVGIWMWRNSEPTVEEEKSFEEMKSNWKPVIFGLAIVLCVIGIIIVGFFRDKRVAREIAMQAKPPKWALQPSEKWPALVLMQKAEFKNHSSLKAGCASLMRLPNGQVVVLTAGHLLGKDGGVKPGFLQEEFGGLDKVKLATLDSELVSWNLFLPDNAEKPLRAQGLFGNPKKFKEDCDQVLLRVAQTTTNWPVKPIDIRITPMAPDEKVYIITLVSDKKGNIRQKAYKAKRLPGLFPEFELEKSLLSLDGCSGAPIIDTKGLLIGIVTGGNIDDPKNPRKVNGGFSAHMITELLPVLRDAWDSQPVQNVVAKR